MTEPWLDALRAQIPAETIFTDDETLNAHSGDAWYASNKPDLVVMPRRPEEVAVLLRFASDRQIPVTGRGAGRGYVGGCVPSKGGIVVSFAQMARILEINKADGVAVVQPGVITGDLQDEVLDYGLFYPPDPASLRECQIGGNIATNAGGPRCVKYGVTRHYVLGLQVALANGDLVRVGGRTHKNKSGFDLVGLFVGSEGLLGLVTEATLRLIPAPPARATIAAGLKDARAAAAMVQTILDHGYLPSSLEIADAFTLEAARKHMGRDRLPPGEAHIIVELDGQVASVRSETRELARLMQSNGALDLATATSPKACEKIWELRRGFSYSLRATGLTKLNEDIVVPRSRLVDLIAFAEELAAKYDVDVACFGHAGDGNIHTNIMVDMEREGIKEKMDDALDELFRQVLDWGGAITGEHGVGLAKKRWWPQAASEELRRLHATVKQALDPAGILNPGKFVDAA